LKKTDLTPRCCLNAREEVTESNAHVMGLRLFAVFLTKLGSHAVDGVMRCTYHKVTTETHDMDG
jgi:hypothetical protein